MMPRLVLPVCFRPGCFRPVCLWLAAAAPFSVLSGCTVYPSPSKFAYTFYPSQRMQAATRSTQRAQAFSLNPIRPSTGSQAFAEPAVPFNAVPFNAGPGRAVVPALGEPPKTMTSSGHGFRGYGFNGRPVRYGSLVDLGKAENRSIFAAIVFAQAAQPVKLPACIMSVPHLAATLKNPASQAPLDVADSLPGLYGAPWTGQAGRSLIALLHVDAPRDAALPVPQPAVQIYKNYIPGNQRQAAFSRLSIASVYRGRSAVLYRVYVGGPILCLDMVVPRHAATAIGHVYYKRGRTIFETTTKFKLVK